ncbi:hypothetical protein RB195_019525 [Necator americanus]|uniref:PNO1 second type I KH domain-containing protein n=1 Tax=Necator americanus TaxID=51031 RepID=A0ABR1CEL4_NECAM
MSLLISFLHLLFLLLLILYKHYHRKMGDDLPMEDIDDMPELIDVDVPAQLPSLIEQNIVKPKEVEEFLQVSKRKRKSNTKDVEMEECGSTVAGNGEGDGMEASSRRAKKSKGEKGEMRKIPVPKHRYTPLKDNWVNIFTPVVKNLGLQIRFTKSIEFSSGIQFSIFCAFCTLVHIWAADFVRAFILGFDVADALALIRLDHLFLETFEVADVKSSLKGDNLSRAVGRIAGKDGRTKLVIENVTKTRIVLADTKIHLLGAFQNLKLARNAISSLILGTMTMDRDVLHYNYNDTGTCTYENNSMQCNAMVTIDNRSTNKELGMKTTI